MADVTLEVPIELIRDLLDGALSANCCYASIHPKLNTRVCVTHQSAEPCNVKMLRDLLRADDATVEGFLRSEREDWIASPDADDTKDDLFDSYSDIDEQDT